MLRSRSIQQDSIPVNRSGRQKTQQCTATSTAKGSMNTPQITFFTGISHSANTLGEHLVNKCSGIELKPIDDFLSGNYQPPCDVAIWGVLRGGEQVIEWARKNNRNFYYFDNAYVKFNSNRRTVRITKNESQVTTYKEVSADRMHAYFPPLQPYRQTHPGKNILVCPPGEGMVHLWRLDNWLNETLYILRKTTNRQIEVRYKPSPVHVYRTDNGLLDTWEEKNTVPNIEPIGEALKRAHAVVTFNSTVAFESLRQGVPVFCSPRCSAALLGNTDIGEIENPLLTDRIKLFATLAYSQWTMDELCDDIAWRHT